MTYADSLTVPVILTSPPDQAPGIGTIINYNISNVNLDWETSRGATSYKWQLDHDTDFSSVPAGFEGDTQASTARLPLLEPATTYYWRVRATQPVLSPWSAKWSFTTTLNATASALELYSPEAGSNGVPLRPVFQWSAVSGADSYELVVSTSPSFDNPTILKVGTYALTGTAWQSNINLDYNTTYYWKIRAIGSDTHSTWSAAGAFITESPPLTSSTLNKSESNPAPLPTPPPPSPPPQTSIPGWIVYLIGGLLLTIILLLITMLVLAIGIRRL